MSGGVHQEVAAELEIEGREVRIRGAFRYSFQPFVGGDGIFGRISQSQRHSVHYGTVVGYVFFAERFEIGSHGGAHLFTAEFLRVYGSVEIQLAEVVVGVHRDVYGHFIGVFYIDGVVYGGQMSAFVEGFDQAGEFHVGAGGSFVGGGEVDYLSGDGEGVVSFGDGGCIGFSGVGKAESEGARSVGSHSDGYYVIGGGCEYLAGVGDAGCGEGRGAYPPVQIQFPAVTVQLFYGRVFPGDRRARLGEIDGDVSECLVGPDAHGGAFQVFLSQFEGF